MLDPATGDVLFARYAYPPNELGYCGPDDPEALLEFAAGSDHYPLGNRAAAFEGAWAYLESIASATGLDPLDARVVEAYWIGNDLLDRIDPAAFGAEIRRRFAGETLADWAALAGPDGAGPQHAVPHHSFQVFVVYPWVRLLGRGGAALQVLDRCRIRDGEVLKVDGDEIVVRYEPLEWDGQSLFLGAPVQERARWAQNGRSLLAAVTPGDRVALHWDWVCDRLTPVMAAELRKRTATQLDWTNLARGLSRAEPA